MMKIYQKIESFALRIIEKLENQKMTLIGWLVTFFAIIYLRVLLGVFSTRFNRFYLGIENYRLLFFHIPAYQLFTALVIILLLYFLTKEKIEKITKIALFANLIVLLSPIIDLIVSGGQGGIPISYTPFVVFRGISALFQRFSEIILYGFQGIFFFGKPPSYVTPAALAMNYGTRIELGLVALGVIWYIFLKTKNIFKVFLGFLCLFSLGLMTAAISLAFQGSSALNSTFKSYFISFTLQFIGICLLSFFWFYIYNKEKCLALFRNLRFSRVVNNLALLAFGLYLGGILTFDLNFGDTMLIILAVISLLLYYLSAVGRDDLSDEKIDKISNPSRPLPAGKFTKEEFRGLSNIFLIASYFTAFAVGYAFFFFILLRSLVGYLYYAPPFRLKRFPVLATFTKALAFLFTIYAGFLLISKNTIFDFPGRLALFVLVAFTLGATVKDIKDYQGDKADGVYTIPVIFGLERGKKIIGLLAFTSFILAPLFFFDHFKILILPAFLAGALSFYLIQSKKAKWKTTCLFLIYFAFGFFFILTVF